MHQLQHLRYIICVPRKGGPVSEWLKCLDIFNKISKVIVSRTYREFSHLETIVFKGGRCHRVNFWVFLAQLDRPNWHADLLPLQLCALRNLFWILGISTRENKTLYTWYKWDYYLSNRYFIISFERRMVVVFCLYVCKSAVG